MRHAKRTDDNHAEVREEFRKAMPEAQLFDLSGAGRGCPDFLCGWRGRNFLFELKDPNKTPSERKLTKAQEEFHAQWPGQVKVVHSAAEMAATIAREVAKK